MLGAFGLAGLGMVLFYLLARRALGLTAGAPALAPPSPFAPLAPLPSLGGGARAPRARPSVALTVALVAADAVMVVQARDDAPALAVVRAVSPQGALAIVSDDYIKAASASGANPTGGVFLVPVGGSPQRIRLRPGQGIYAKGSVDDVLLSATMEEE